MRIIPCRFIVLLISGGLGKLHAEVGNETFSLVIPEKEQEGSPFRYEQHLTTDCREEQTLTVCLSVLWSEDSRKCVDVMCTVEEEDRYGIFSFYRALGKV